MIERLLNLNSIFACPVKKLESSHQNQGAQQWGIIVNYNFRQALKLLSVDISASAENFSGWGGGHKNDHWYHNWVKPFLFYDFSITERNFWPKYFALRLEKFSAFFTTEFLSITLYFHVRDNSNKRDYKLDLL